jgi:hypothetical protein
LRVARPTGEKAHEPAIHEGTAAMGGALADSTEDARFGQSSPSSVPSMSHMHAVPLVPPQGGRPPVTFDSSRGSSVVTSSFGNGFLVSVFFIVFFLLHECLLYLGLFGGRPGDLQSRRDDRGGRTLVVAQAIHHGGVWLDGGRIGQPACFLEFP